MRILYEIVMDNLDHSYIIRKEAIQNGLEVSQPRWIEMNEGSLPISKINKKWQQGDRNGRRSTTTAITETYFRDCCFVFAIRGEADALGNTRMPGTIINFSVLYHSVEDGHPDFGKWTFER